MSSWTVLFDANRKCFFDDYARFNANVEALERRGRDDLLRQGFATDDIRYRLELDMRYGNQRVQTAVVTDLQRIHSAHDVLKLIEQFHARYGERFGKGSQAPRSEEHTSELQSLMRISYAVFCLKKKTKKITQIKILKP